MWIVCVWMGFTKTEHKKLKDLGNNSSVNFFDVEKWKTKLG